MKRVLAAFILCGGLVPLPGCDDSDPPAEDTPLEFTAASMEAVPLIEDAPSASGLLADLPPPPPSAAEDMQLAKFFHYECHLYPQVNYCPPEVDVAENDGMNPYKFTGTTLMGLIHHAEGDSGGLRAQCWHTEGTIGPDSFQATATAGADPDRYVLDQFDLYSCKGSETYDESGAYPTYVAYSVQPDFQATLKTALRHPSGNPEFPQSNVSQVYVGIEGRAPTTLALNAAGVSSMNQRAIILVNLATHRFVAKYLSGGQPMNPYINAVGVGGVDRSTGTAFPGHYWATFTDNDNAAVVTRCVDNEGQLVEADDAPCLAEGIPVAWQSAEEIAAFLDLPDDDVARLAPFFEKLATSEPLPASEVPLSDDDLDKYFPKSFE